MRRGSRGFTLVELVVALTIMAVAAAAVVPALARLGGQDDLTRSADQVAALLRGARAIALGSGATVTVLLDPATRRFAVASREGGGDRDSVVADGALALADGVHLQSGSARVRLTFDGTGPAVPGTLAVAAGQGRVSLWVDRWTGEVRSSRDGVAR